MNDKELIERLRAIPDDDKYCGVDAGRTTTCHASWLIDEAADALEAMSAVVEAARAAYNQMDMTPELYDLEDALTALDREDK